MKRIPATRPLIGDVFELSLPDGRFAYAQYLHRDKPGGVGFGILVRVLDRLGDTPLSIPDLRAAQNLFPPVYVGLLALVRLGRWRHIGRMSVPKDPLPCFRWRSGPESGPGEYSDWYVIDLESSTRAFVGPLSPELRRLEFQCAWGSEVLAERIAYGRNPYDEIR